MDRRHLILASLGALAMTTLPWAALGMAGGSRHPDRPAASDVDTARLSDQRRYSIAVAADRPSVPLKSIHSWTVRVTLPDGTPVDGATVRMDGAMPEHGHGLPTQPRVTAGLGDGRYKVEGMKFSMTGWWTLTVEVDGPAGRDSITFNLVL